MKRLSLLGLFAPALFVSTVEARDPGHSCFVQMNGKTTDLSISMCRNTPPNETELAASMIAELRWKVSYLPRGAALSEAVSKNSKVFVDSAKAYCEARKQGATDAQIVQVQFQAMPKLQLKARNEVVKFVKLSNQVGVKHFCPELL